MERHTKKYGDETTYGKIHYSKTGSHVVPYIKKQ
ncbi:polymorphic toxin type 50 domain-containing protein [Staphylococcus roterodami]|nr:polymorphic toxin type 50 domain-containing protein [Staphylococcus roterodami]